MFPIKILSAQWLTIFPLLAEAAPGGKVGTIAPVSSPLIDGPSLALATGAVALVLLAAMLGSILLSARQGRHLNSPRRLLCQLCQAHGLARHHERLLFQAARVLSVEQPARFFLEPRLVREAAKHPALASRHAELKQLLADLFGPGSKS
jgi:hypothetical protein